MKLKRIVPTLIGVAALALSLSHSARADVWDKRTDVKFTEPVEFPGGVVLPPGSYVMKLNSSPSNRHIVHVFNRDQNRLHATVLAIPEERMQPADETIMTFYESPADQPQLIRSWFYPGDTIGQEFVYPKERVRRIASASRTSVPFAPSPENEGLVTRAAPANKETPVSAAADRRAREEKAAPPALLAQAGPPKPALGQSPISSGSPAEASTPAPLSQLPATAGSAPIFALTGALLGATAFLLRFLRGVSS